jgi:hypothetical protein
MYAALKNFAEDVVEETDSFLVNGYFKNVL